MTNHYASAEMLIRKPIDEVFEAFIDPNITSNFWFTKSSGPLQPKAEVIWSWEMYQLSIPVKVKNIIPLQSILIEWGSGPQKSTVEWTFRSLAPDKTFVSIRNFDFQSNGDELLNQVRDSTGGFTIVLAGLKAWMEHGIKLGLIGDKFPEEMR